MKNGQKIDELDIFPTLPTRREKGEILKEQLKMTVEEKGEHIAIRELRKHTCWYFKGEAGHKELNRAVNFANTYEEIEKLIDDFLG